MSLRKRYDGRFKAQVVLEALRNQRTLAELASGYGIHPNQITRWKRQVLEELPHLFSKKRAQSQQEHEAGVSEVYRQIGQLKEELDWARKKIWTCRLSRSGS